MHIQAIRSTALSVERVNTPAAVAAAFLAAYREPTRQAYRRDLAAWATWLEDLEVEPLAATRVHVDAFVRALEERGSAPATIARRLAAVAGFYAYAIDERLITANPVARVRRPRVDDESPRLGLAKEEVAALLALAAEGPARDHALLCVLVLNGLRVSEAVAATAGQLSTERGHRTLSIVRKGGKRGLVPLAPRTAVAIDDALGGRAAGPILATRSGKAMDRHAAHETVRRYARRAGIGKAVSPHLLRHSFVTLSLDAGVTLRDVQDAAGHADPRTTRRYDRGRHHLDRAATYRLAAFLAA